MRRAFQSAALCLVFLLLTACGGTDQAESVAAPGNDPSGVASQFYEWYLATVGSGENPLVSRAYRNRTELHPSLIAHVDDMLSASQGPGFDPFLCAQDIPGGLEVGQPEVTGEAANVPVTMVWNPKTEYESRSFVTLDMSAEAGVWIITEIVCPKP
ncbi:MAG: hypothetical protein WBZ24_10050 [Anaerolineales bacterium]